MRTLNQIWQGRVTVGAALVLILILVNPCVAADKTEPILAHIFAKDHIFNDVSERFIRRLDEISNGTFDVRYHPGGDLGGWTEMVEQVSRGPIEMTMAWNHSELDRRWDVAALGFLVNDWEAAQALYGTNSPLKDLYEDIAGNLGMELLGVIPISFRGFIVREGHEAPRKFPEDAKGFKIRVPGWQMAVKRYEALGFSPVTMPFAGVHTALQTGAIDGAAYQPVQQVPLFADVIDSFVYTHEDFEHGFWLANKDWLESLTAQQREWVRTAANEVIDWSWGKAEQKNQQLIDRIEKMDVDIVTLSPKERKRYRKLVTGAERPFIRQVIGSDTLQKIERAAKAARSPTE